MAHDLGVLKADGEDWTYYGIEDTCWAQNKRDGRISMMRYRPTMHVPRKMWYAARFSDVPPEIQREYLLWRLSR